MCRVHLVNGMVVDGTIEPVTEDELEQGKRVMADLVMGSGGWQVNLEQANGNWAVFPKQSVLFVEYVIERESDG
jgi:hypothetical protein